MLGGRITLIKVALSNIPVFYMSLFTMPIKVACTIEKYQRDFLWEGGGQKKGHLVKWKIVVKSNEQRGAWGGQAKGKKMWRS